MTRQRTEVPMEVEELHTTISELSAEITRLQDQKKELEANIVSPDIYLKYYTEHQNILNNVKKAIDDKNSELESINKSILNFKENLLSLQVKCNNLEKVVNEKKEYISDIESYKKKIAILQAEMAAYQDKYNGLIKSSEAKVQAIKDQMASLRGSISNIEL